LVQLGVYLNGTHLKEQEEIHGFRHQGCSASDVLATNVAFILPAAKA
jgi:hypothetical protein